MALVKLVHIRTKEKDGMFAKIQFSVTADSKRCLANITLGEDLAKMIDGDKIPEKVDVYYDDNNPYFLVLKKAEGDKGGFRLRKIKDTFALSLTWRFPYPKKFEDRKTKKCGFDTHLDGGIQVHLDQNFTPYPGG